MSRTITITISVDVDELISSYPSGGTITDHNVISMSSDSGEDTWENGYLDKLITLIDESDVLIWKIVPLSGSYRLSLSAFIGDTNKDTLLQSTPVPVSGTQNTQWTCQVKSTLPKDIGCSYCFKFTSNYGRDLYWQWDPFIKSRR